MRLIDPFGLRRSTRSDAMSNALMYRAQPWNTLCAMVRGLPETRHQFESVAPLDSSIAVTALSAENTGKLARRGSRRGQAGKMRTRPGLRALSERSRRGAWHAVPGRPSSRKARRPGDRRGPRDDSPRSRERRIGVRVPSTSACRRCSNARSNCGLTLPKPPAAVAAAGATLLKPWRLQSDVLFDNEQRMLSARSQVLRVDRSGHGA